MHIIQPHVQSAPVSHGLPQQATENDRGFFAYHGWLAPGIRLFRNLGFPSKAALIALSFCIPLVFALASITETAKATIATAEAERDGLHYIVPFIKFVDIAQKNRQVLLTGGRSDGAELGEARSAAERAHAEYGIAYGDSALYAQFQETSAKLASLPAGATPEQVLGTYNASLDVLQRLILKIADRSTLSLDPAATTYNLISFTLLRGVPMTEHMTRLKAVALLAATGADPKLQSTMTRLYGAQEQLLRDMDNAYEEAIKAEPQLASTFDRRESKENIDRMMALLARQIDGEHVSPETLASTANAALDAHGRLYGQAILVLERELDARIAYEKKQLAIKFGLSMVFVLIAAYFLFAFYKVMTGGLRTVALHLDAIAEGNLTTVPAPWGRDEAAQLMHTMRKMQERLQHVVKEILDGSTRMSSASHEIAAATQGLSDRTEQSAGRLEEAASSMEEIGQTIANNQQAVEDTAAIVGQNASAAQRGQTVVAQLRATMDRTQAASREIAGIVGVIDSMAFQTNLLALNAAVEAARAGEHGRGFAVVAQEVRYLAGRSAEAAKNIKSLIDATVSQVLDSAGIASEAEKVIGSIHASAQNANTLIAQLKVAAQEQSTGVRHVHEAMVDIDAVTQENAAMVEETSSASQSLANDATRLAETASFFKFG